MASPARSSSAKGNGTGASGDQGRTAVRPAPEPVPVDAARIVAAGTALWVVALLALLPFWSRLSDAGNLWWLWTCVCGAGLGVLGLVVIRRHRGEGRAA